MTPRGRHVERGTGHYSHSRCTNEYPDRSPLVVLEFPDYATALACYRSPEYARALAIRQAHSIGDVVVVEGYDGPQPGAAP